MREAAKMTLYRIYTEDTGNDKAEAIASRYFANFTVFKGQGYWRSIPEFATVIEILTDDDDERVQLTAFHIKQELKQEAVLIVAIEARVLTI
jgi:hypothetical protein